VTDKSSVATLALGVTACAACCAGPILALLAAAGIASSLGLFVLVFVLAISGAIAVRRHRSRRVASRAVPLDPPRVRIPA
jgi:hypothetical protein